MNTISPPLMALLRGESLLQIEEELQTSQVAINPEDNLSGVYERLDSVPIFNAGNTKNFITNWKLITSDPWVISMVQGVKISFFQTPIQPYVPSQYRLTPSEKEFGDTHISQLLVKSVLKQVEHTNGE